jgi:hypothetical protein
MSKSAVCGAHATQSMSMDIGYTGTLASWGDDPVMVESAMWKVRCLLRSCFALQIIGTALCTVHSSVGHATILPSHAPPLLSNCEIAPPKFRLPRVLRCV